MDFFLSILQGIIFGVIVVAAYNLGELNGFSRGLEYGEQRIKKMKLINDALRAVNDLRIKTLEYELKLYRGEKK
jgi:hypothetical protein